MSWHTQAVCTEAAALQCPSLLSTSLAAFQPTTSASGTSDMDTDVKVLLCGNSDSNDPLSPTLKNLLFEYLVNCCLCYIQIYSKVISNVCILHKTSAISFLFFNCII